MAGTVQVPSVPNFPCAQHTKEIAELHALLANEIVERRAAQEESLRLRKEIQTEIGVAPDPIRGIPGSGLKGALYQVLVQQRQSMITLPDDVTRDDLLARVQTAEKSARTSRTKLIGTVIGAILGGIVAAATTIMSMLGK